MIFYELYGEGRQYNRAQGSSGRYLMKENIYIDI